MTDRSRDHPYIYLLCITKKPNTKALCFSMVLKRFRYQSCVWVPLVCFGIGVHGDESSYVYFNVYGDIRQILC